MAHSGRDAIRRRGWLGLGRALRCLSLGALALPAAAHIVSMSSGELQVEGNRARYELRMPLYEIQHVRSPETELLERFLIRSQGRPGRIIDKHCRADQQDGSYRCQATYEWPEPVENFEIECQYHTVTVSNHVHLLQAVKGEKSDQAVFDYSATTAEIRFRPPTAFELWVKAMGAGFARAFSSGASVLFLICLALAARSGRELLAITAAFLAGEVLPALLAPQLAWRPAPRFVEAALALTLAYLAVEILALPEAGHRWLVAGVLGGFHGLSYALYLEATGYGAAPVLAGMATAVVLMVGLTAFLLSRLARLLAHLAAPALRCAAAALLVTGLAWFFLRLRA